MFFSVFNPCSRGKYKLLNKYDRLVGNKDQSSVKCDQRDVALPGWFRFTGAAGDRMPTKCPETKRCGTHASGWLNGKHPSVADGIVSREVCYHWSKNCCRRKNKINVKNCGAFYLYELQKPPACSLRYCGEYLASWAQNSHGKWDVMSWIKSQVMEQSFTDSLAKLLFFHLPSPNFRVNFE